MLSNPAFIKSNLLDDWINFVLSQNNKLVFKWKEVWTCLQLKGG